MIKRLAYRIVLSDLKRVPMFSGIYDAKHGSRNHMYGILSVMEYIANSVSEKCGDKFDEMFIDNLILSQDKAKETDDERSR